MLCLLRRRIATVCWLAASLVWLLSTTNVATAQSRGRAWCPPRHAVPYDHVPLAADVAPDAAIGESPTPGEDNLGFDNAPARPMQSRAGGDEVSIPVGGTYIDPAFVVTQFRLRLDAAYNNPWPNRAEWFWAKNGAPGDPGPPLAESGVDYQDIASYFEYAPRRWLSGFVELPVRFLNPEQNSNTAGLADMNFGFKTALWNCEDNYLTFQFRTYLPTGDADRGLGTNHVSLEPALLFQRRLTDRALLFGEAGYWMPIDGTDFAGDVVRYGLGGSYDVWQSCCGCQRLSAITEFVGWTVVDGLKSNTGLDIINASGETIVNAKFSVRATCGDHSVAASWGHAISDQVWYEDIFRLEYRRLF